MCNICCLLLATTQINELSKTSVNSGFPQVQGVIIVFSKEFCSPNVCWVDLKLEGTYLFCYELFSVEHNAEIHQYSSEFWDLVNIRYGWPLSRTSKTCTCGNNFNIEHALTCKKNRVHYTLSQQTKKHNRQPTKGSASWCSHWTNIAKADKWTIWTKSSEHIGWNKIRRITKRILGGRSNSFFFWHESFLLKCYQIC